MRMAELESEDEASRAWIDRDEVIRSRESRRADTAKMVQRAGSTSHEKDERREAKSKGTHVECRRGIRESDERYESRDCSVIGASLESRRRRVMAAARDDEEVSEKMRRVERGRSERALRKEGRAREGERDEARRDTKSEVRSRRMSRVRTEAHDE